ncbi:MAG: hydantoinase/oxoprolinase family protein [Rubrivivax sp.]
MGVDVGGTFTDVVLVNELTGQLGIAKVLTTYGDFGQGVVEAVRQGLQKYDIDPSSVCLLSHATTVVTNALLEGKGASVAFVATRGFRDTLELRRGSRGDLYDLFQDPPDVLVPRRHRFEITERIDAQGQVVTPLAEGEIAGLIESIRAAGVQTVAVSLLFSFLNPTHEKVVGRRLREALPGIQVFLSHEVLPEIREYERASTTAVCAYVGPMLQSYLERLQRSVSSVGLPKLHIMGSSGGVFDVAEALRMPAMVVESGPAAGVMAAALVGRQIGNDNLIAFDMGGTTAKASVIADGVVSVTAEYEVGGSGHVNRWSHGSGHPIRVPVIDLAEVSSGGGSIAWVDAAGGLKVGPKSAGSTPGPAGYGRGGTQPTVSDANIVLGYLDRQALLGGALKIDLQAAEQAIAAHIAQPLGLSVAEAAARIIEIVNSAMSEALRIVSVERGYDPRDFSLIAYGGAGPVHAVALADSLQIPTVVIPPAPGAFSALGLVVTDFRRDYSRTLFADLSTLDPGLLASELADMERVALEMLANAGIAGDKRQLVRSADVRYRRQAYELTLPLADGPVTAETLARLAAGFHARHAQLYGHADERETVHLVNLRLAAVGKMREIDVAQRGGGEAREPRKRSVWFEAAGFVDTEVVWRDALAPLARVDGPAIVESFDSTIVIPPSWAARADARGFLHISRK